MALKDKGVVNRAIVTPDKHFPLHDKPSINVLCKTIEIVKPDIYVDLGDIGEWSAFSAWKYKRKKAPPLEFMILIWMQMLTMSINVWILLMNPLIKQVAIKNI